MSALRVAMLLAWILLLLSACGTTSELTTDPIKWFDADNKHIPEPDEIKENKFWDAIDHTIFYQVGKVLDLGWTARRIGNLFRIVGPRQADNINALDEVPNSSWFTNRHFQQRLTLEELAEGPGFAQPDDSGPWEIVAGKFEGVTAGFTIKDASQRYFVLKFDSKGNGEMGTGAEVVVTKVLHAAGYNVPRNSIVYFDPGQLEIGPKAKVLAKGGGKRSMTHEDLQEILDNIVPEPDGRLRCIASQFLTGKPVGVFNFRGGRKDDPNDRVDHEHRRELRGLRVIGSWLNDVDRRAANTLDMYVTESEGRSYVRHYIIDMGSALGSGSWRPRQPKTGNDYVWNPRTIFLSLVSLGFYRKKWEEPLPMPYPSLGYFESEIFSPKRWVPDYPNPAFERCTNRDGYWGAKIVMAFRDAEIRAMVERGLYSDPDATAELTRLLVARRDKIGRYWFTKVNPLDHFELHQDGLTFRDLAVDAGLEEAGSSSYEAQQLNGSGRAVGDWRRLAGMTIELDGAAVEGFQGYEIRTRRGGGDRSKGTRVFFHRSGDGQMKIVKIDREE